MKKSRMGYAFFGKNLESTDKKAILHDMTTFCLGKKREGPYFIFYHTLCRAAHKTLAICAYE